MVRRVKRLSPPQLRSGLRRQPRPSSARPRAAAAALATALSATALSATGLSAAALSAVALSASACQTTAEADDEQVSPAHEAAADADDGATSTIDAPDAGAPATADAEGEASAADLSFIHDQLILKPKLLASGERPAAEVIRADVEAATGAAVAELRPGPVGIVLVVFAATDPPRDGAALAELQAALEATDAYEYVQPNRLYEAKSGEGGPQAAPPR